ncbi:MFS transporter [Komagataeibacter oboediens]|uniref:MFS transporter n=1 Tax=Komagataeibacter oboediens TaxID=65958 RepID=A0ABS5SSN7_9PROT|nr:MFS transporter [Komagataeibacter oboediens]MBL7233204.1 MFS transporter [Komagataeibacter oboediens]MBT0676734.1 MFS transporter [Komagataeibacter oboediens]MBT0680005.1 MFS transporter [Komagataeibacter oboediens]
MVPAPSPSPSVQKQTIAQTGLTRLQTWLFAFPALPAAFIILPMNIFIPAFYASHTAVTLLQIGTATSLCRVIDALLDPAIGFLSDRSRTRFNGRGTWGIASGVICCVALFFLFQPSSHATILYYGVWAFVLYFGYSLFEIPRSAWSAELGPTPPLRTRINAAIGLFTVAGSLIFWLVPVTLFQFYGTTGFTQGTLRVIVWLYAVLMLPAVICIMRYVPDRPSARTIAPTLRDLARSLKQNRPLALYFLAIALWGVGQGIWFSTTFLFLNDYLRVGSVFPLIMIVFFLSTIVAIPLWGRAERRMERHALWAISMILSALTRPLALLPAPGMHSLPFIMLLTAAGGALSAPANFMPYAILADVIDYDIWKTGTSKSSTLYALNTLITKTALAMGSGAGFIILGWVHYHAGQANHGPPLTGLLLCYTVICSIPQLIAAMIIFYFPIGRRAHTLIRHRLNRRRTDTRIPVRNDP